MYTLCLHQVNFHVIVFIYHCSLDRYVLVGNHRDAWVFGAVDPLSGTAVMMELSRSLGNLLRKGNAAFFSAQILYGLNRNVMSIILL